MSLKISSLKSLLNVCKKRLKSSFWPFLAERERLQLLLELQLHKTSTASYKPVLLSPHEPVWNLLFSWQKEQQTDRNDEVSLASERIRGGGVPAATADL